MENVTPLKSFCIKALPAVYDDSLSYYEVVCKVQQKLNEVIGIINQIDLNIFATKEELANAIAELDAELRNLLEVSQAEQTVMMKAWTIAKLKEAVSDLEAQIDNAHISDVMVIDPEESVPKKSLQDTLYNQNQNYRMFADCAKNLDTKQYTVSVLEGMGLEAYVFDFFNSFSYSMGMLPIEGNHDGNYLLSLIYDAVGGGGTGDMADYVKKHDILAYYFNQKQ